MLMDCVTELIRKEPKLIGHTIDNENTPNQVLYTYGSTNKNGGGAGIILEGPDGITVEHSLCFNFQTMNNQEEYEAFIVGLKLVKDMGVKSLRAKNDSQLVVSQVNGVYETKVAYLSKYLEHVRMLLVKFDQFQLERIPRAENDHADTLAKLASMKLSNGN